VAMESRCIDTGTNLMNSDSSGYNRLEEQISWYDKKSGSAQRNYKLTKYFTISASALIPILALYELKEIVAVLGASIAIFEGANQVNQWQHNWITYRATCEALRHEKYTYIEKADPYDFDDPVKARKLLVERIESLISTEHSKWIAVQDEAAKNNKDQGPRAARAPN
jgi:Protein of unknown function (DUF4231)